MKTYEDFLEEIDQFYTVGSIIEININENEGLYGKAIKDGFIRVLWSASTGRYMMEVLRMPNNEAEDLSEWYFN